jgi:hypothetical protein
MENIKPKINWRILLYGAIGFIMGEIIVCLIDLFLMLSRTTIPTIEPSIKDIITSVIMSAVKGSIGSAALGLALKDKKKILYLSLAGAIGFAIGAIFYITIIKLISNTNAFLAIVLGSSIAGAIGSAALGLALKDKKKILYLSLAGAIGFAIAGIIRCTIGLGVIVLIVRNSIVGILLGLALGLNPYH